MSKTRARKQYHWPKRSLGSLAARERTVIWHDGKLACGVLTGWVGTSFCSVPVESSVATSDRPGRCAPRAHPSQPKRT